MDVAVMNLIERVIPPLTLLAVVACLLLQVRLQRRLDRQQRHERAGEEQRRRRLRYAYAASLLQRMTPRRQTPVEPAVIDLAEGASWQRR
jgi:hypothetical protein